MSFYSVSVTRSMIGLSGYARSGKDSAEAIIRARFTGLGARSARFAFADALKRMADPFLQKTLGISAWTKVSEEKKIIRPFLVGLGESCRALDPSFWVKKLAPSILASIEKQLFMPIITDVRYKNEAEWVKSLGGIIVYIGREGVGPANDEEARTVPEVAAMADHKFFLPNFREDQVEKGSEAILAPLLDGFPLDKLAPYR